ncbi:MAG: response regulator [Patescibacteria group bacterium]
MPQQAKILLAEDDSALRQAVSDKLTREGFQVIEAKDGEEGLRLALAEKPDIILLDIIMPKMHGMEVLEKLRADQWGKTAKIILITNLADDYKVAKAAEMGVKDYLIKGDWKLGDVVNKIREKLDKK